MNAGQALGLLAGLGAVNALGGGRLEEALGGRAATGKRFTGLLDMLDGGGAGQSGDKFEGGGLVSMLGNLFAKPLEAQERVERIAKVARDEKNAAEGISEAAMAEMERQQGLEQDKFDTRDQQGATSFRNPNQGYPDMTMPAIEGYTVPRVTDVPTVVSDYPDMSMPAIEGYSVPAPAPDVPVGLLNGNQIVPPMPSYNPTVPKLLATAQDRDFLSPITQQDYAEYSDYLRTGQYPRGAGEVPSNYLMPNESAVELSPNAAATPVVPEAAGLGMSDADQMMAIRSAIMRDPKKVGALEEAFGVDMVREALAGLRMVGGSPVVSKAPLTRRDQRGLLPTMPITRFN